MVLRFSDLTPLTFHVQPKPEPVSPGLAFGKIFNLMCCQAASVEQAQAR